MVILLILILVAMITSDFRYRQVYVWQLALFAIVQTAFCFLTIGKAAVIQNTLVNGMALLFISLCVGLYLFIRFRKKAHEAIGWGDILFVFILIPYFPVTTFLYFMIVSLLLTLGSWAIYYFIAGHKSRDIPLISTLGICYCLYLIYNSITG